MKASSTKKLVRGARFKEKAVIWFNKLSEARFSFANSWLKLTSLQPTESPSSTDALFPSKFFPKASKEILMVRMKMVKTSSTK